MTRRDWLAASSGALLSGTLTVLLLGLLVMLLWQAANVLSPAFLWQAPQQAGLAGGIGSILVSTLLIMAVCLAVVIPAGLGCAIFISEQLDRQRPLARALGFSLDVLAATPSIVFALFGYQFFADTLGLGFSIAAGGLTLACMALPLMVRGSEQALRGVPADYRQAGAALALSHSGMLWRVLLPQARSGIAAAIILSLGRALAETAVLLFTAGYVMRMPGSLLDSGRTLSVHIYDLAMHVPGGGSHAAASAVVLIGLIVMLNALVHRLLRPGDRHDS